MTSIKQINCTRVARARKTTRQVYSARTSCFLTMERKIFVAFFSILVILEMTASFPLFRYHPDQSELESGAESGKPQDHRISETSMQGMPDVLFKFARIQRSSEPGRGHVQRHKHREHGLTQHHLSKDQSKTSNTTKRMSPKLLAIFIFLGCSAFMSLVFGIACCKHRRDETKRVKKATDVDVRSREDISQQVSQIENAHVDVGSY